MDKKRDGHAIVSNVIKSLEKGDSFSPSDRAKFARVAREHGIEGSVIEEVIDIGQTLSLIILGWLAIAAAGYGGKKGLDAKNTNDKAKDLFKKAEELLGEIKKRVELAQSSCENAFARFGEKKLHVISRGVSRFVEHFNQLKGHEFVINNMDMQNIQEQVSEALNVVNECKEMGLSDLASLGGVGAAVGVLATYGAYTGISAAAGGTVLSSLGGALAWMSGGAISLGGGLAAMALIGGVGAASVIAILGVLSDKKMKKARRC
nr:glycine zipper family protein [Helicobacter pylori]